MTVRVVDRFDGKRLEACDHVGSLSLSETTATCQECGCVWNTDVAWGSLGIHQRVVTDEGTANDG